MASKTNDDLPDTVSENGEGTVDAEGRSRRDILRGLAAAAAGAVAGGVLSTEKAEADHGVVNASSDFVLAPAVHAEHTTEGTGVEASSFGGTGVEGTGAVGVDGIGNTGVRGSGGVGVEGSGAVGVRGRPSSASGYGVWGSSPSGIAVLGESPSGTGVVATGLTALHVQGNAKFSTAGSGSIPANQDSVAVSVPFITALSHVTVTLTGDPGQASSVPGFKPVVVWVERQPGTGFVVHMSRPVRVATPFTYLVVEPVSSAQG
jgi:hypothetical protein